jgi:hypothetical protein
MDNRSREGADQLVRLTRSVIHLQDRARVVAPSSGRATRTFRQNGEELTGREQQVLSRLLDGGYDRPLSRALQVPESELVSYVDAAYEAAYTPVHLRRRLRREHLILAGLGVGLILCLGRFGLMAQPLSRAGALPRTVKSGPLTMFGTRERPVSHAEFWARLEISAARELPRGIATATSFWDPWVALGRRMSYETVASPYWPLGTKVRILYKDKSTVGVVRDFGPADWAIVQHRIPAIIDLSEPMMQDLTGSRVNSVPVRFDVISWGDGQAFHRDGPGYRLAMNAAPLEDLR